MKISELREIRDNLDAVVESLGRADASPLDIRDEVTGAEKQITRAIHMYLVNAGAVEALKKYDQGLYNLEDLCSVIHGIVEGMQ